MAKRRGNSTLNHTAEAIGASLGKLARRVDTLKVQRNQLASDIHRLLVSARGMLSHGGVPDDTEFVMPPPSPKNKGGRSRGYKVSAATKAKLRAAWERRRTAKVVSA